MALDANKLSVLAGVNAEGVAPGQSSGENQEAEAPKNGYAANFLSGNLSSLFATGGAWGSASAVVVAREVDDHGSLLLRRRSVHGLRGHHHWLSVHVDCINVYIEMMKSSLFTNPIKLKYNFLTQLRERVKLFFTKQLSILNSFNRC